MEGIQQFLPLILIVAVMYFLMIRPQQKKQKQMNEMRKNIKKGDKVSTAGGLVGKVVKIKDEIVTIETGRDKVRVEVLKQALTVMDPNAAVAKGKDAKEPEPEGEYSEYVDEGQDGEAYEEYELDEGEYYEDDQECDDDQKYDENYDNQEQPEADQGQDNNKK